MINTYIQIYGKQNTLDTHIKPIDNEYVQIWIGESTSIIKKEEFVKLLKIIAIL
jgi:hypothetical protein